MKKYILAAFALAAVLSGCVKDELTNGQDATIDVNAPVFYAGFADASSETKTYVNENGHLRWNADDRLTIFVGKTLNTQYAFDGEDGDNAGGFNQVSGGSGFVTANPLNANYAVYPYSISTKISEEGVISLSLPEVQAYGENSFGRGANTMVALTENKDDYYLPFKNACGYLVVSLFGDATITSVSLEGNNGEKLAGAAYVTHSFGGNPAISMKETATGVISIDCGDGVALGSTKETATAFWFVVPQTTFSKGITISATSENGTVFRKSTSKTISIERNKISTMSALEYKINNNVVVFDDANFKAYCVQNFDKDGDGEISFEEAGTVASISCRGKSIKSLKGIEYFTVLNSLTCDSNQLTSLDVSNNSKLRELYCSSNQLSSLNVSGCTEMRSLYCSGNRLTSLDVSMNSYMSSLDCSSNELSSLDVRHISVLLNLDCSCNQLTSLECDDVFMLNCSSNKLSYIPWTLVSVNTLNCSSNQLTSLDVSRFDRLSYLDCSDNRLTSLDVSMNIELYSLDCSPMSTLKSLYIAQGQSISCVTKNRNSQYVPDATEIIVIPQLVDLGLPGGLLWASFNLGATKPEEYGGYYQWAGLEDVTNTSIYLDWSNCPFHKGSSPSTGWTKYIPSSKSSYWSGTGNPDNKTILDPEDDVAHVKLGGKWRMPTIEEFQELKDNCTSEWTKLNGVKGRKFTSKINGNSIFLPAAGYRSSGSLYNVGSNGHYWSSSLYTDSPRGACYLSFDSYDVNTSYYYYRSYGHSVRPVSE